MTEPKAIMGFPTEFVREGKVKVMIPKLGAYAKSPSEYTPSKAPVFYNPVMELNRDLAVLALQAYQEMLDREIVVCEPLTGCGIRGIRYAAEIRGVKKSLIADINEKAFQLANYNVQVNRLNERITVKNDDANFLLSCHSAPRKRFDVIDIDPFGSPVPYLDSAIRALRNNGLLALTATDMAPLCGVHPRACTRKYGGKPLRTEYCHELAVRLLAGCLATTAARHDIGIDVVFGHSTNHYIRVYATIEYGAKKADESIKNMGYVLHCFNCFHRETAREIFLIGHFGKCSECNSKLNAAGPLWLAKIFDGEFCDLMIREAKHRKFSLQGKIGKISALVKNEVDAPITYYVIDKVCDKLNLPAPSAGTVIESLKLRGFQASLTHFNPKGMRSNAPAAKVEEILREIAKNRNLPSECKAIT